MPSPEPTPPPVPGPLPAVPSWPEPPPVPTTWLASFVAAGAGVALGGSGLGCSGGGGLMTGGTTSCGCFTCGGGVGGWTCTKRVRSCTTPPEPLLPPPPPPAGPGPPPPIFCSITLVAHHGPMSNRMISRWTSTEPNEPPKLDCFGSGIPTGPRYRGRSRDSRSKVPGVMSPNDTTDEPQKVRPSHHFLKDPLIFSTSPQPWAPWRWPSRRRRAPGPSRRSRPDR